MESEHLIRLRGGWECIGGHFGGDPAVPARLTLPVDWPDGLHEPLRLTRRFSAPPLDPEREQLLLRLADIAGLCSVALNDRLLAAPAGESALELPLAEHIAARNVLVLEVDPRAWADAPGARLGWGSIALVVRPR
jgi:hypothetical protein